MLSLTMKNLKKHSSAAVGALIVLVAAGILVYAIIDGGKAARTVIGFPLEQYKREGAIIGSRRARVQLTADQFNSARLLFAGSTKVSITPNTSPSSNGNITFPTGEPEQTLAIKNVILSLTHTDKEEGKTIIVEQGSSEVIELKSNPRWAEVAGKGNFTWQAQSITSSFWYPFDRYLLHVNPSLIVLKKNDSDVDYGTYEYIETMEIELSAPNLRMNATKRQVANSMEDPYEIVLKRPLVLRILTIFAGLLVPAWLYFLYKSADTGSNAGKILAFFFGIWAYRETLLSGFSVFPIMLDYVTLTLAIVAVTIIILKWRQEPSSTIMRECPYCKMKIPLEAKRCPQCTSNVPSI